MRAFAVLVAVLSLAASLRPGVAASPALADAQAVYDRAAPAVAVVQVVRDGRNGIGTGFAIAREGLLLTAAHVARRAEEVTVEFPDGRLLRATLKGYDARRDLALLAVRPPAPLPTLEVVGGPVRAGEPVVVIGAPRGRAGVMTTGEVTAPRVSLPGLARDILVRVSASVAPGNSGGPVLNRQGQVIGLVIAGTWADGGGALAVAGDVILATLPALREGARVERAWIGVAGETVTPLLARQRHLATERGALIREVVPDSPAAAADLRPDDVIVALDGIPIATWTDLLVAVGEREPGRRVQLAIVRGGTRLEVAVTLGVRP
ncbi:MAG: trypsin-like peptidase domain-containing protein [Armatimonadota bacterium]|nr:trypsin-like peptidase domain-containing protein [Armatimonadota bacterium]